MKTDYSYQDKAANVVLQKALSGKYAAAILGACPSSGKTTISHMIISNYIALFPNSKVLVLTEGQNALKNQYLEELANAHIKIDFTYGALDSDAQVRVGIPQSISKLDWMQVDLLIVDESHRFFMAPMVQSIVKKLNPIHTILMTGSPTQFNGKAQYAIHYISAEELQAKGIFSGVRMDVVKTQNKNNAKASIRDALLQAKKNKDNMSKIMVACPSIGYANEVAWFMREHSYSIALSTSENDKDDVQIKRFKSGEANVLIVVGKGVLGFNDSNITLLIDMKSSNNLDNSQQLFSRVLRKHPKNVVKTYYRISDKDYNNQVLMLHKMIGLMQTKIFKGFTGKNLKLEMIST